MNVVRLKIDEPFPLPPDCWTVATEFEAEALELRRELFINPDDITKTSRGYWLEALEKISKKIHDGNKAVKYHKEIIKDYQKSISKLAAQRVDILNHLQNGQLSLFGG